MKTKGVSQSSFLDLKAQLAVQKEELARNKAAGKAPQRPTKKGTVWERPNKGVEGRAARDIVEIRSQPSDDFIRANLQRKANKYDKLSAGLSGGLSEPEYNAVLIDFDAKAGQNSWVPSNDDIDESLSVPMPSDEDDPVMEYEDEFGRIRRAPRSEIPRNFMPKSDDELEDDDDGGVLYNPQNHFPTFDQSVERRTKIDQTYDEQTKPLNVHYSAHGENRAQGAAFYQQSQDEQLRKATRAEMDARTAETRAVRAEAGAVDVRIGEVEGMQAPESSVAGPVQSRAAQERKRKLEERKKEIDAKRKKSKIAEELRPVAETVIVASSTESTPISSRPSISMPYQKKVQASKNEADDFLANLENDMLGKKGK